MTKQSPTEERLDLAEFDEDLPHSLPGMRPVRFPELVSQERRAYRAFVRPLRRFRQAVFALLDLRDRRSLRAKVEWSGYSQQQWDKAIAEYLWELQGNTDIRAAADDWYFSDAALPEEWRFGMRVGIGRATLLTGASEAALESSTTETVRSFGQIAFERLSDQGNSRLANILQAPDYPGGSVRSIIAGAVESGENPMTTARLLSERFDQYERWEFARLTRTEVAFAQEAGIRDELHEEGFVEIPGIEYPPYHPNICLPGNRVWGTSVLAAFRAYYDGPAVEVSFAESGRFSVAVHHPILTLRGWVAAGELRQGDYLICDRRFQGIPLRHPHNDQVPARIEDVFAAALVSRGMASVSVPVAAEDLHGDGRFCQGEVNVVRPNCLLRNGWLTEFEQGIPQQGFETGYPDLVTLPRARDLAPVLRRLALASDACMGIGSPTFLLLGGDALETHALLLVGASYRHAAIAKARGQVRPADTGLLSQEVDALSGFIAVKQVLQVRRFRYAGHAYDLQSPSTAYILSGVVSSNCVCSQSVDVDTGLIMVDVAPSACEVCQAALIAATVAAQDAPKPGNPFAAP